MREIVITLHVKRGRRPCHLVSRTNGTREEKKKRVSGVPGIRHTRALSPMSALLSFLLPLFSLERGQVLVESVTQSSLAWGKGRGLCLASASSYLRLFADRVPSVVEIDARGVAGTRGGGEQTAGRKGAGPSGAVEWAAPPEPSVWRVSLICQAGCHAQVPGKNAVAQPRRTLTVARCFFFSECWCVRDKRERVCVCLKRRPACCKGRRRSGFCTATIVMLLEKKALEHSRYTRSCPNTGLPCRLGTYTTPCT